MINKDSKDSMVLVNGEKMPAVGFGTWKLMPNRNTIEIIKTAFQEGYRHIDTAAIYQNERQVGRAIIEGNVPRRELFVTSKLWNLSHGYHNALVAFKKTLRRLRLNYLDLYLIHWPCDNRENWREKIIDTWRAFEELYDKGLVKAIGVSNFKPEHFEALLANCNVAPMVNQIELHIGKNQEETLKYCKEKNIVVEAYSPLGRGKLLDDERILEIAQKHNKTAAQVCLKWCLQKGAVPLPKASSRGRIKENAEVFDFELTKEDVAALDNVEKLDVLRRNKD